MNGGWTEWSLWSSCDQSCDGGWRFSKRACSNPVPQHGGLTCDGVATIQEECNLHICPGTLLLLVDFTQVVVLVFVIANRLSKNEVSLFIFNWNIVLC